MVIANTDIKVYLSGGASNTVPASALGGARSTTTQLTDNTLDNLFPDALGSETLAGSTSYLCVYVRNEHATLTATTAKIYITQATDSSEDEIDIGLDAAGKNGTAATIANINTAPAGASFSHPTTYAAGLSLGDLAPNDAFPVWFKRTINASLATPVNANSFKFEIGLDSAA